MADPISAITLAYLAGIVDSDGHVTIHKSVRKGVPYFAPVIGITGTRRQPHDLAASIWGGNVWSHKPKNPRHREVFVWARQGQTAVPIIEWLRPYLLVKRDHADLALSIYALDSVAAKDGARLEMVHLLNQDRRAPRQVAV